LNARSQQARSSRPTPWTTRPLGLAIYSITVC
jgi:hypothetical protein